LKKLYLAYHSVLSEDTISDLPVGIGISKSNFRIHCLAVKNFFIPLYKLIYGPSSDIIMTFDDGYKDNLDNALGFLKKYQLKAVIFITTSKIGNFFLTPAAEQMPVLTAEQIKECSDQGVLIAVHGREHRFLDMIESRKLFADLQTARTKLEEITKRECSMISYPFGRVDPRVIEIAGKSGFKKGFIVRPDDSTLKQIDSLSEFTIERTAIDGSRPVYIQLIKILPFYNEIRRAVWKFKRVLKLFSR
jgi:peptidoglycan/xylan/chitin deacetylase (PgdA/CDA1 family)